MVQSLCKVLGMVTEVGGNVGESGDKILGGEKFKDLWSQDIWKSHLQYMKITDVYDRDRVGMSESEPGEWRDLLRLVDDCWF